MTFQSDVFPPFWKQWVDDVIPRYVKKNYSPKENWKTRPFSEVDARFFFRGVEELSALFTEDRPRGIPPYFRHPKFRSAYLLYFLPLQAAKFLTLFDQYPHALEAALRHAKKEGVLRVADLGAGPGTASLSLLLALLGGKFQRGRDFQIPQIEFHWLDTNGAILKDGQGLVDEMCQAFPQLKGKIKIRTSVSPWKKFPELAPFDFSLILMGHLLNESLESKASPFPFAFWEKLQSRSKGGGILMVEPATRKAAQTLSFIRDSILDVENEEKKNQPQKGTRSPIWGPCLHAGKCPLGTGRDWCHWSVPLSIPGKWFKAFSRNLGSERHWLKLAYLWLASPEALAPPVKSSLRRVVSDPLNNPRKMSQGQKAHPKVQVLLCEPETPRRVFVADPRGEIRRGDLVDV